MKHRFLADKLKTIPFAGLVIFNLSLPGLPQKERVEPVVLHPVDQHISIPENIPLRANPTFFPEPPALVEKTTEAPKQIASAVISKADSDHENNDKAETSISENTQTSIVLTPIPVSSPVSTPTPTPEPTLEPTPQPTPEPTPEISSEFIATPYDTIYQEYADRYGIDVNQLKKIGACESGHNATSVNGDYLGIFQFSTSTWQSTRNQMSLDPNPDLRTDPIEAIHTAAFKIGAGGIRAWAGCL